MGQFVRGDAETSIIVRRAGCLKPEKLDEVVATIIRIVSDRCSRRRTVLLDLLTQGATARCRHGCG